MTTKPRIVIGESRKKVQEEKDFRFNQDQIRSVAGSEKISTYREDAYKIYRSLPLPDTKLEAWRRTDLQTFHPSRYVLPPVQNEILVEMDDSTNGTGEFAGSIQLTPESVRLSLDPDLTKQGVIFADLRTAEKKYTKQLERAIGSVINPNEGKFSALAAAFSQNGIFLYVPKNVVIWKPLKSLISLSEQTSAYVSHIIIFIDEGASVTFFHEYNSLTSSDNLFHSGLIETHVGENARLKFVEIQSWNEDVWNFTHERVRVEKDGSVDWIVGALGSKLTKTFMDLDLVGPGAEGKVSGFSFTNNDQHLDYDTQQNHLVPHTTSDLLYKVALTDKSRSVWQGMIYVAPGAVKTDGYQSNKNLLLSDTARADSIPGLEILADDVRCTHGATIGDLDFEQIFYLMSRGIPRIEAEKMLVEGFFDPIMQRIPFESVRNRFTQSINLKLNLT